MVLRGLRDIGLAAQTCDRDVPWFSNPKSEAGTYLRAAWVPMATTEVWCQRLAKACVLEWLRQDTGPLNMTYTLSFIIAFSCGLSVRDDFDALLLWQLNDYSRGNLVPLHKNCDYFWLVCQKILFSKAQSRQWDGWCGSVIFPKSRHVRKASVSLIP